MQFFFLILIRKEINTNTIPYNCLRVYLAYYVVIILRACLRMPMIDVLIFLFYLTNAFFTALTVIILITFDIPILGPKCDLNAFFARRLIVSSNYFKDCTFIIQFLRKGLNELFCFGIT